MVDYALANKIAPFQAPNLLALAQQGQQMQSNMLAAQKFQQDLQLRSGLMREIEGGLDLTSPEAVNRLARYSPELALTLARGQADIAQSRAAAESSRASAAAARATAALTGKKIEEADLALVSKHGDAAREGFARILNLAQDDPELASQAYDAMLSDIRKRSLALASQFSPKFSVDAARRGLLTVEQLQAQAQPKTPEIVDLGNGVKGVRDPKNPLVVHEIGVLPFGRQSVSQAPSAAPEAGGAALTVGKPAPEGPISSSEMTERLRRQNIEIEAEKTGALTGARLEAAKKAARPKVESAYVSSIEAINRQIRDIEDLESRTFGLMGAVGPLAGRPYSPTGLFGFVQGAQALIDKIKSTSGLTALQDLRQNSPTGSGVGNVSNEEGRRLENSQAALNQLQNTDDFREKLTTLKSDLQQAKSRLTDAFQRDYGGPAPKIPGRAGTPTRVNDTTVSIPNGPTYMFPNKEAADKFREKAGL